MPQAREPVSAGSELVIECRNVSLWRGNEQILAPFDWRVAARRLVAVIGPNGGGKSTLLAGILGLLAPSQGEIRVFGLPPARARTRVAYLPQEDQIDWSFPLSVEQVVLQGRLSLLPLFAKPGADDREVARRALRLLDLEKLSHRPIGALSGGQRQRVFLARAIAQGADLLLLDEPTNGLDASAQHDLLHHLQRLRAEGKTIVMVTHDLSCLADHFDELACIDRGLIATGPPREVLSPSLITRLYGRHFPLITPQGEVRFAHHHP